MSRYFAPTLLTSQKTDRHRCASARECNFCPSHHTLSHRNIEFIQDSGPTVNLQEIQRNDRQDHECENSKVQAIGNHAHYNHVSQIIRKRKEEARRGSVHIKRLKRRMILK